MGPLCPISIRGSPVTFLKFQIVPRLIMSSVSKEKEPRYACRSETKASHLLRMWAEVSSSAPHLLHNGLSDSSIRWRCLLRVLCPVRRPLTILDCGLLKERNLALASGQGPEINSWACLWVLPRPCHHTQCWLTNHCLILLISCLETPKAGSGPKNFKAKTRLASLLVISFPRSPACPGTQYSPTTCLLALLDQWRCCSGSLKCFQSHLIYRTCASACCTEGSAVPAYAVIIHRQNKVGVEH